MLKREKLNKLVFKFLVTIIFLIITSTVFAIPYVDFSNPTPSNNTYTTNTTIELNFSITESSLNKLIYNWDGTNYTIFNNSLILLYNFDNISTIGEDDTNIVDISRYSINGTVTGRGTLNSSGKYNSAYSFSGKGGINTTRSLMNSLTQFTMAGWVYASATGSRISFFGQNDLVESGFIDSDSIMLWVSNGGNIDWTINSTIFPLNTWNFVVFVGQNSTSPYLNLYINGLSSQTGGEAVSNFGNSSIYNFSIGQSVFDSTGGNFTGSMDNVMVFNRSLTSDEIYHIYISNLRKYDESKYSLYINQSQNATNVLFDKSYTYFVSGINSTDDENMTEIRTIGVDTIYPSINTTQPINNTNSTDQNLDVLFTRNDTNLGSCWYSTSAETNITLNSCSNITDVVWDDGQFNLTIWVNDSANQQNSSKLTFSISVPQSQNNQNPAPSNGGGGSGSSSGYSEKTSLESINLLANGNIYSYKQLAPGKTKIEVQDKSLVFDSVEISTSRLINDLEVKLTEETIISNVENLPGAYRYLIVDTNNLLDSWVYKRAINFKISKSIVNERKVSLYIYENTWKEIETNKLGEISNFIYYKSKVPHFSVFAVKISKKESSDEKVLENKIENNSDIKVKVNDSTNFNKTYFYIILFIVVLILTFLIKLIKKASKKEYTHKRKIKRRII